MPIDPILPDYLGACISSVVPAVLTRRQGNHPEWLPEPVRHADQVVLLVLDGLGWEQMLNAGSAVPVLSSGVGGPITSVVPTTTAAALTSIATGMAPSQHGVVGYRLHLAPEVAGGRAEIMNVLRWQSENGDLRQRVPAPLWQPSPAFLGTAPPAVTRAEFNSTGFTAAHLRGARHVGWRVPSTLVVEVRRLLAAGESFVYAYYDGIDKVAHEYGLGEHYAQELCSADRLVGDLLSVLPVGATLVVTADHGQVDVGTATRLPAPELLSASTLVSGEGRFRWLHARPGALPDMVDVAIDAHGAEAWVVTREQMIDDMWFGGPLDKHVADRLGDLALVARAPVAFLDPADTGETRLLGRHGSLTSGEMFVPLIAWAADHSS